MKIKLNRQILAEINLALTISLASLLLLETLWPGLVLAYINLNLWLILWLISVIILLLRSPK